MPELINVRRYQPLDPYNHVYDNLPIEDIVDNLFLINSQVDISADILRVAAGDQGTLSNRLGQFLEENGDIKAAAIDESLHNIAAHEDGSILEGSELVEYVRMKADERSKLNNVAENATNLKITVETQSGDNTFDSGTLEIGTSSTISWRIDDGVLKADSNIPYSIQVIHHYDIAPVFSDTVDYQNYQTTSVGTNYIEGSLKIYVNGSRLTKNDSIYVPGATPNDSWVLLTYTEDTSSEVEGVITSGKFALSDALTSTDIIYIDFDQPLQ